MLKCRGTYKGPSFYSQKFLDYKILWNSRILNICLKKVGFFIKFLTKVMLMLGKRKLLKMTSSFFNGPLVVKWTFEWPQFAPPLLSFAHITHIEKKKYSMFLKMGIIGQTKWYRCSKLSDKVSPSRT